MVDMPGKCENEKMGKNQLAMSNKQMNFEQQALS